MLKKPVDIKGTLVAAGVSLGIGLMLFTALANSLIVTVLIFGLGLGLIIYGERSGGLDRVYRSIRNHVPVTATLALLFILSLPVLVGGNSYFIHVVTIAGIYAIVALGLNFQIGSTGMVNFAGAAFFGMGAYSSALLVVKLGLSPWLGLPFAVIMAVILGVIIGFPALKTSGYYLSLVTIAFQIIFTLMIVNINWVGGPNGIPGIPSYNLAGYSLRSPLKVLGLSLPYQANYYYLVFIILCLVVVVGNRLYNSRVGLAWNAIQQDEIVAVTQGINLTKAKLLAFSIGAAFAGLAGALYAHYMSFIGNEDFDFHRSLIFICMVLLGGMDNVIGVGVGAILLTIIDEKLQDFSDYRMLMYSVIIIIILLARPQGLFPKRNRQYQDKM